MSCLLGDPIYDLLRHLYESAVGEEKDKLHRVLTCTTFHDLMAPAYYHRRGCVRAHPRFSHEAFYKRFMTAPLRDRQLLLLAAEDLCMETWGFSFDINVVRDEVTRLNGSAVEECE